MDVIQVTYEMETGEESEDSDAANPLSRSVNRLLENGQPFRRLSQCFYSEKPASVGLENYRLQWLGVFIISYGDRVIFFPGFITTREHVLCYRGNQLLWNQQFDFDHISLEKDYARWHITSPKSKGHLGSLRTSDLGEGRYLWFGMSISDASVLRVVSKKTRVVVRAPSSDTKRRSKVLIDSRRGAKFQIVERHPDALKIFPHGFLHLSVIVGPAGFEFYRGANHGFPEGSPFLTEPLPSRLLKVPIRLHRVSLSDGVDLQITSAWLPGKLKVPVTFTASTS